MSFDTGFDFHVAIPVDREGERPAASLIKAGDYNLRAVGGYGRITEKWFDVTGLGYGKNWMWVRGCMKRPKSHAVRAAVSSLASKSDPAPA